MPTLKPVGHQSTKLMERLVLMVAMAAWMSLGTTTPRYDDTAVQQTAGHVLAVAGVTLDHLWEEGR